MQETDTQYLFERNLLALFRKDAGLAARLSRAESAAGRCKFLEARQGGLIPAWTDEAGAAHPLHSLVDPQREAARLASSLGEEGFIVLLGIGGGFLARAVLARERTDTLLVIDFCLNGMAELLRGIDFARIFTDPRFNILVDPGEGEIEARILSLYQPALAGGFKMLPLRARTDLDPEPFRKAREAVERALRKVEGDYSVQAWFGKRWFSNAVRNLAAAEGPEPPLPPQERVEWTAVVAAGPSLDTQLPLIRKRRGEFFLIAADTSLPALLAGGIEPDAVVSIDCQHTGYHHFMEGLPKNTLLFLDLVSPPLLASLTETPRFFSGGHPFTQYISRVWRAFPKLDTSGGNVTYTAVSLAAALGARRIELFGADFSYPLGMCYARGAYFLPYFARRETRLAPLEALVSRFLYRGKLIKKPQPGGWGYETGTLTFYRERLEEKAPFIDAEIVSAPGLAPPLKAAKKPAGSFPAPAPRLFAPERPHQGPQMGATEFLEAYARGIRALPRGRAATRADPALFVTLLPLAASFRKEAPCLDLGDLIEEVKAWALGELAACSQKSLY